MSNKAHYIEGMEGCSDGGCLFNYKAPGTMVTNGGCSCMRELQRTEEGFKAVRTIVHLRRELMGLNNWQNQTTRELQYREVISNTMLNKVSMIKDVRLQAGCGLKEAKEAVDNVYELCDTYEQVIAYAVAHYKARNPKGYCVMGDNCHCGGDVPAVRAGCFEWKRG